MASRCCCGTDTGALLQPDVRLVFGDTTMQASLLERAEHRKRYRLVGVRHEIAFWPEGHTSCPPLGEQVSANRSAYRHRPQSACSGQTC